jgi:uncharacterized protein YbjT (DUF2867 family)
MVKKPHNRQNPVLLTGATGYIGGRLLRELERGGYRVRCMVRQPEYLIHRVRPTTEVVQGDVFDEASMRRALKGIHTAYYLVHSLAGKQPFEEADRKAAEHFGIVARESSVKKIIYLGGLGRKPDLSKHLASRQEVGEVLRRSGTPTLEFRASIVIGSGSLSYEMVRALVEKLPVMTAPVWVRTLAQPIAIEDVIRYLMAALDVHVVESTIIEIGGSDRVSYEGIMREYARIRGLKRLIIHLPFLSPRISSLWLALVTPLYFKVGRLLIDGVRNPTLVTDDTAERFFEIHPRGMREAIVRAIKNEDREFAETRWTDALAYRSIEKHRGGIRFGSRLIHSREANTTKPPHATFQPIQCIGGETGWYSFDWLWSVRGFIDKIAGGVGRRRTRRDPRCVLPGDVVDFWRVEAMEQDRLLRLHAEMKMPGRAWLQFEVEKTEGGSLIRLTAIFDPIGVTGLLYWYLVYPLHILIFRGMLRAIVETVETQRHHMEVPEKLNIHV